MTAVQFKQQDVSVPGKEIDSGILPRDSVMASVLLGQAYNAYAAAWAKATKQAEITLNQYVTLWSLLASQGPMTPTEISNLLPLERHSVSQLLERLERRGLIKRRHSKLDRRIVNVSLTPQGRRLMEEVILPEVRELIIDIYQKILTVEELRILCDITRKIRDASVTRQGVDPSNAEEAARLLAGIEGLRSDYSEANDRVLSHPGDAVC